MSSVFFIDLNLIFEDIHLETLYNNYCSIKCKACISLHIHLPGDIFPGQHSLAYYQRHALSCSKYESVDSWGSSLSLVLCQSSVLSPGMKLDFWLQTSLKALLRQTLRVSQQDRLEFKNRNKNKSVQILTVWIKHCLIRKVPKSRPLSVNSMRWRVGS